MSGLEITGVVLGTLPLIISALEHCGEGVATAKRFWRYKSELRLLILQINTERRIFLNTCEQLLTGIVRLENMADFLNAPGGDSWNDALVKKRLEERLDSSYETFVDNVHGMEKSLKGMMEKLKLDPEGKVQFRTPGTFKRELKRLKFSISRTEYADLLSTLQRHNYQLTQLTKQSLDLEPFRTEQKSRSCPDFKAFQRHAVSVYTTLRSSWGCLCQGHEVNLRLEARTKILPDSNMEDHPFRVILSYSSGNNASPSRASIGYWKEAEIRAMNAESVCSTPRPMVPCAPSTRRVRFQTQSPPFVPSTDTLSRPTLSQIQSLCNDIAKLQTLDEECIGYLEDETKRKFGIYLLGLPVMCSDQWTAFSLKDVLSQHPKLGSALTQNDKLRLAVDLASSVLQLYNTPWLKDNWGKDDVFFIHRPWAKSIYDHPFVSRRFSPCQPTAVAPACPTASKVCRIIRNETLFTLGVLLIELWYGKSIEELQIPADRDCEGTPGVVWCTADRLVDEIEFQAGKRYSEAVRRCVRCDFDRKDLSLDSESFQQAMYNGVVALLERTWEQFNRLD